MTLHPLAPVVVFAFNRSEHLKQTLESLSKNELATDTEVFIYCDGPRGESDLSLIAEVKKVLELKYPFRQLTIIEREENFGLARSIISGVTEICEKYKRIIVLEDDMITSPFFLRYMNDGLNKYEHNDEIISLHGYVYPLTEPMSAPFFLKGADCWGWATWSRGWNIFNPDSSVLYQQLKDRKLLKRLNYFSPNSFSEMLKDNIEGKNNSWAIRWYASALLANKLTLYPSTSLINNIGHDGSGTHCGTIDTFGVSISKTKMELPGGPFSENKEALREFSHFFKINNSKLHRFLNALRKLL